LTYDANLFSITQKVYFIGGMVLLKEYKKSREHGSRNLEVPETIRNWCCIKFSIINIQHSMFKLSSCSTWTLSV